MDKEKLAQLIRDNIEEIQDEFAKELLVEWLETGMEGESPVDLEELGFDLSDDEVSDPQADAEELEDVAELKEIPKESEKTPEELMGEANEAIGKENYAGAAVILQQVIDLDSQHTEAKELYREVNQKVLQQQSQQELVELKSILSLSDDIEELDKAVNKAHGLMVTQQGDADLERLMAEGKHRRDEKIMLHGGTFTAAQTGDYKELSKAIDEINAAISRSEKTWYDPTKNQYLPINEVADSFDKLLKSTAIKLMQRLIARAQKQEVAYPEVAIELLTEARSLKGLDTPQLNELDGYLDATNKRLIKKREAEKYLKEADDESDAIRGFRCLQRARNAYPDYPELKEIFQNYGNQAMTYLGVLVDQAEENVSSALANEETEALAAIATSSEAEELPAFGKARQAVQEVQLIAGKIDFDNLQGDKQVMIDRLQAQLDLITQRLRRRNRIQTNYFKLKQAVDKGQTKKAKTIYNDLDIEYQNDVVIKELGSLLDSVLGVDDKIVRVERLLDCSDWLEALEELDKLADEEQVVERISQLRAEAEIGLLGDQIDTAWFDDDLIAVDDYFQRLDRQLENSIDSKLFASDRKNQLYEKLQRSERLKQIGQNRPNDEGAERQIREIEKLLDKPGFHFEALDQLDEISQQPTNYRGRARRHAQELRNALGQQGIDELARLRAQDLDDYEVAYDLANNMQKYGLIEGDDARKLRLWAVVSYYEQEHDRLKAFRNWEEIIKNWENAARTFKAVRDLWEKLAEVRKACLIDYVDESLKNRQPEQAILYLESPEEICVFDPDLPFIVDIREDQDLRIRKRISQAMIEASTDYEAGNYEVAIGNLDRLYSELERPELAYLRDELQENAVSHLLEEGNKFVTDENDLPRGIEHYARAMAIEPDNLMAQQRIKQLDADVRAEITRTITHLSEFEISLEPLDSQLEEARASEQKALNLIKVSELISDDTEEGFVSKLEKARAKVLAEIPKIEGARRRLRELEVDQPRWLGIMRQGKWNEVDVTLRELRSILPNNHPQLGELAERLGDASHYRNKLEKAEAEFQHVFNQDEFDKFDEAKEELLQVLAEIDAKYEGEPFGIIHPEYFVVDRFSRGKIIGLDEIIKIAEARAQNFAECQYWHMEIEQDYEIVKSQRNHIDDLRKRDKQAYYDHVHSVEEFINTAQKIVEQIIGGGSQKTQPQSIKARTKIREAETWGKEIEKRKKKENLQLQSLHKDVVASLTNIGITPDDNIETVGELLDNVVQICTEYVNNGQFDDANGLISFAQEYYRNASIPNKMYLDHLKEIIYNN